MKQRIYSWAIAVVVGLTVSTIQPGRSSGAALAGGDSIFPPGSRVDGYKLGLLATACWMGGVWSDSEGAHPATWRDRDDQRCRDLVLSVWGRFDQARYEQIRAMEDRAVDDLLD